MNIIYLTEYQEIEEKLSVEEFTILRKFFKDNVDVIPVGLGTFRITASHFIGNIVLKEHVIPTNLISQIDF